MTEPKDIHQALEIREDDFFEHHKETIAESEELSRDQKEELAKYLRFRLGNPDIKKKTAKDDLGVLITIFEECFPNEVDVRNPSEEEVRKMAHEMRILKEDKKDMADTTYNDYIQVLRNYYLNLVDLNDPLKLIIETKTQNKAPELLQKISNPERKNEVPNLTTREMVKLIRKAPNRRDACIIALYLELGVRI